MTGLGFADNPALVVLVLLLVIGGTWLLLRARLRESAATRQRHRADKGKVRCQNRESAVGGAYFPCKNKAGWVTPHGYFCEDHWEINSKVREGSAVRWAKQLVWRRTESGA